MFDLTRTKPPLLIRARSESHDIANFGNLMSQGEFADMQKDALPLRIHPSATLITIPFNNSAGKFRSHSRG